MMRGRRSLRLRSSVSYFPHSTPKRISRFRTVKKIVRSSTSPRSPKHSPSPNYRFVRAATKHYVENIKSTKLSNRIQVTRRRYPRRSRDSKRNTSSLPAAQSDPLRIKEKERASLEDSIIIDSDDEDTYYVFSSYASEVILRSAVTTSRDEKIRKARLSITKQLPKVPTSMVAKPRETKTLSMSHPVIKPLAVVCSDSSSTDSRLMGPPPSPFLGIRNASVRPVDRIPISPYTRSPESAHSHVTNETPHALHTRRITRSSPQKPVPSKVANLTAFDRYKRWTPFIPYSIPTPSTSSIRSVSPVCSERRLSVRQTENVFKYKHILVKKTSNFTQVILNATVGNQRNSLTLRSLRELTAVLNNAKYDDTSRVILITGSDNGTFCSGLDLTYLTTGDIHLAARTMSDTLLEFVRAALSFPKPLVAAVNGQAVGCGVALLPLCDVVYASDKATFFTPYTQLSQVPEAGLSCSLPQVIGIALANEMLMAGRMLTALEAYQMGLVAQVFWPTSMMQEVIPRITNMATACSSRVLNATKSLIRSQHRERLLAASHAEASMQVEIWSTPECQRNMKVFLEHC